MVALLISPNSDTRSTGASEKAQSQFKPLKRKGKPLQIVALLAIALLCVAGLFRVIHQPAPVHSIEVIVAGKDLPPGVRLGFTSVRFLEVPKQYADSGMITSLNAACGRVTRTFIPAGEPITTAMIFRGKEGVSANLETWQRAITLQITDDAMVDHLIRPDDRVDVLVVSSKDGKKFSKTICQNVPVLMAAPKEEQYARRGGNGANKITLALSAQDSETVTEASEVGKIRLVLRNSLATGQESLSGSQPNDLLPASGLVETNSSSTVKAGESAAAFGAAGLPPAPTAVPGPPLPAEASHPEGPLEWVVQVISGNHRETYSVPQK